MRVLVVDDDPAARKILGVALVHEGFDVRLVDDGRDALGALSSEKWKPEVMVLDYLMPHFNGADVLEGMHVLHQLTRVPVIILTSEEHLPDEVRLRADRVLRKPANLPELIEAIRALGSQS